MRKQELAKSKFINSKPETVNSAYGGVPRCPNIAGPSPDKGGGLW
jgi:hypothetical protein